MLMNYHEMEREAKTRASSQFDMLTERGYTYDMIKDEYRSPDGKLIVPGWPPAMPEEKKWKGKKK